jgi:predicted house-cleaning noncanonical NTP pyrophosphatase (MazG superfamily)
MTAIYEQLIRDHVAQILRDSNGANQTKQARGWRRRPA